MIWQGISFQTGLYTNCLHQASQMSGSEWWQLSIFFNVCSILISQCSVAGSHTDTRLMNNACAKPMDCPCWVCQLWAHSCQSEQTGLTGCSWFTNVTQHTHTRLLASLLCCQSFYFYSSSPLSFLNLTRTLKAIKAGKIWCTWKEITLKDNPLRDA